jgi:arylsulfatase A-like enzyme
LRRTTYCSIAAILFAVFSASADERPNVILMMADDLGWGDTGYNEHPFIHTPNLDAMAANGLRFDRFYAASPVCSPTRASCLTGRHPERLGITGANDGHLPHREMTIAEALRPLGYTSGHFGKWHLGTLTKTVQDSNRGGPRNLAHYSPPWEHGFDVCFSTEAKVPTYDPMIMPANLRQQGTEPGESFGTYYWTGPGERVTDNLEGDDSRIIMDRAIPFIRDAVSNAQPFFAVIWFHAPHLPVVAGAEHRALYDDLAEEGQHYHGCITALDEQVGRLRAELRTLGVAENTMLWFSSDNGPEGREKTPENGSAGPFSGRKRSLREGGVRVPGLLEWPGKIPSGHVTDVACVTSDYFPTVMELVGVNVDPDRPLDGISLADLLDGTMEERPEPIAFKFKDQLALGDTRYKLYSNDGGTTYSLFDLLEDPSESTNIAADHPEIVAAMTRGLAAWERSLDRE